MEELTRLRAERGWSQQRLADESSVNKATINQIERGRRSPNVETLEKLADALEVGVADFFPKAQPPLWSDRPPERRGFDFREAREGIEEYCGRWERIVSEGELDDAAIKEFFVTGLCWIPVMDVALRAELNELRRTTGLTGREISKRSEIAQANERYHALFGRVSKVFKETMDAEYLEKRERSQNVTRLEAVRKRLDDMPNRMTG